MPDQVHLLLVGTSHRHAPIAVREQLAAQAHGQRLIEAVIAEDAVIEAVGLSTCNRCELYMVGSDPEAMRAAALRRLADYAHRSESAIEPLLYVREGGDAAEHLFEVAGGLDSLVPGEAQILAQIRDAYASAFEWGSTGPVSNRLFHVALEAGKRVRHETAIGAGGGSVASVAAEVASERLGGIVGASVLVVGAGRVAELVAANLTARGAGRLAVANRDPDRAAALAARFGGTAIAWDDLAPAADEADVVVSSTAAPGHVITAGGLTPGRTRLLIDLAMPRDIDPAAAGVEGTTIVDLDGLEAAVRRTLELRLGESGRARAIVAEQAAEFRAWMAALRVVPAITSLRDHAERIRAEELRRMEQRWDALSPADRQRLDAMTRTMLNKLLHEPTVRLKELAAADRSGPYADAVTELFGLAAPTAPE